MEITHGDIASHRRHLANVPPEVRQRRLGGYRLDDARITAWPIICLSDLVTPKAEKWRRFMHPLDPISLDDLKNWFGVPNEAAKALLHHSRTCGVGEGGRLWGPLTQVHVGTLPAQPEFDFGCLDSGQRTAVLRMSERLLYGYVDPEEARQPRLAGVIRHMIERAKRLQPLALVLSDLIVCPDDHIIFDGFPLVVADNILIYGNGRITVRGRTRIDAAQIRHVDA